MAGLLLIDKPAGITSHDVIDRLRRITGIRTIGHAGTLDPFATGLLIVAVEREATKHLQEYVGLPKEYIADICIGKTSSTLDPEGDVVDGLVVTITNDDLQTAMASLTGDLQQIPPMHAAIKVNGKKLYELAREGKEIERAPRAVTVSAFEIVDAPYGLVVDLPTNQANGLPTPFTFTARIRCSSGTYVRALARDLGTALGTVGYLTALRRTTIGDFSVEAAVKLDDLTPTNWIDAQLAAMVPSIGKS